MSRRKELINSKAMRTVITCLLAVVFVVRLSAQDSIPDSSSQQLVTYYTPYADSIDESDILSYSDTIITNTGETVVCRITEVSPEVIYFVVDTLPDVTCVVATSSVFMLKYSNGTHDLGSNLLTPDYYAMGREDGHKYFRSREAVAGTFVSGLGFWIMGAGIVSATIITAVPPKKIHNKENPNDNLLNTNQDYYDGYMRSARNKKVLHSSLGFAGGVATLVATITILVFAYW
jgi:hypothetical protein